MASIHATGDRKVELVSFANAGGGHTLAHVTSSLGYPAYYPLHPVALRRPVKAVLMDLDGTSVHSEPFWIWIIEQTTASLLGDPGFELEPATSPTSRATACPSTCSIASTSTARARRSRRRARTTSSTPQREMRWILEGRGRTDAFVPAPGLKEFLLGAEGHGASRSRW